MVLYSAQIIKCICLCLSQSQLCPGLLVEVSQCLNFKVLFSCVLFHLLILLWNSCSHLNSRYVLTSLSIFFYSVCRRRLDLAFLIDGSGSIETSGRGNFQRCIEFVKTVVSSFSISPSRTRVGVALFSSRAWLILNFYRSTSKAKVLNTISRIRYPHGGTRIGKALYFILNRLFRRSRRALKVKLYKG